MAIHVGVGESGIRFGKAPTLDKPVGPPVTPLLDARKLRQPGTAAEMAALGAVNGGFKMEEFDLIPLGVDEKRVALKIADALKTTDNTQKIIDDLADGRGDVSVARKSARHESKAGDSSSVDKILKEVGGKTVTDATTGRTEMDVTATAAEQSKFKRAEKAANEVSDSLTFLNAMDAMRRDGVDFGATDMHTAMRKYAETHPGTFGISRVPLEPDAAWDARIAGAGLVRASGEPDAVWNARIAGAGLVRTGDSEEEWQIKLTREVTRLQNSATDAFDKPWLRRLFPSMKGSSPDEVRMFIQTAMLTDPTLHTKLTAELGAIETQVGALAGITDATAKAKAEEDIVGAMERSLSMAMGKTFKENLVVINQHKAALAKEAEEKEAIYGQRLLREKMGRQWVDYDQKTGKFKYNKDQLQADAQFLISAQKKKWPEGQAVKMMIARDLTTGGDKIFGDVTKDKFGDPFKWEQTPVDAYPPELKQRVDALYLSTGKEYTQQFYMSLMQTRHKENAHVTHYRFGGLELKVKRGKSALYDEDFGLLRQQYGKFIDDSITQFADQNQGVAEMYKKMNEAGVNKKTDMKKWILLTILMGGAIISGGAAIGGLGSIGLLGSAAAVGAGIKVGQGGEEPMIENTMG